MGKGRVLVQLGLTKGQDHIVPVFFSADDDPGCGKGASLDGLCQSWLHRLGACASSDCRSIDVEIRRASR